MTCQSSSRSSLPNLSDCLPEHCLNVALSWTHTQTQYTISTALLAHYKAVNLNCFIYLCGKSRDVVNTSSAFSLCLHRAFCSVVKATSVTVSLCVRCSIREDVCERQKERQTRRTNMHVCVYVLNVLPSGQCAPLFAR